MQYLPKLNPSRGFMIEKAQPFTRKDIELAQHILDEKDELVIGIGSAEKSHEHTYLMTAGERIELTDRLLQSEGIDPNRYILVPIEDAPDATEWVANSVMVTPHWDTIYTRNFKNAAMFATFQHHHGYAINRIEEQKSEEDIFGLYAKVLRGEGSTEELQEHMTDATIGLLEEFGIDARVENVYNRSSVEQKRAAPRRSLFLGGLQPIHGVYADGTGHLGCIRKALDRGPLVVAVGSAQASHMHSDPLLAGKRIDVIRYALQSNGVDAGRFHIIPVRDVQANAWFASKVVSMCPAFDAIVAGNDWTKQLFGHYDIIPVDRENADFKSGDDVLSATGVRTRTMDTIRQHCKKDEALTSTAKDACERELRGLVDPHTLSKLRAEGFYEVMHFLAYAKE